MFTWTWKWLWVGFQILTAANMETSFCDIALCGLVEADRSFRGAYCLHHQDTNDGGSKHLWNVGLLLRDYIAQYPTGLSSSTRNWFPSSTNLIQSTSMYLFLEGPSEHIIYVYVTEMMSSIHKCYITSNNKPYLRSEQYFADPTNMLVIPQTCFRYGKCFCD
jgi:hypothetical protein